MTAQGNESIADINEYARETLRKLDEAISEMDSRRQELALRLAVMDAAQDSELQRMADEVVERIESGEGFPKARPAEDVLAEAHRRYVR